MGFSTRAIATSTLLLVATAGMRLYADEPIKLLSAEDVLNGLQRFYSATAREDGSFQPGIDPEYRGMSDSAYSDLAPVTYACTIHRTFGWKLSHEEKTIEFLLSRQKESGEFVNVAGTVDPGSPQGKTYNTTQGLVALHALGRQPKYDPLPVFEDILKQDYKTLPSYSTSFFPLAYLCAGKPIPAKADRDIRALMVQDREGYLDDHIAATFHAAHYYSLVGEPTPKSQDMLVRILRDQRPDGSWLLNLPSRDRHATFDAVFTLRHEGHEREDCKVAIERAAQWALSCRNSDGGFGHFPGSTSDADANYFQVGTLVMAGFLKPVDPLPKDPHLLSWGHLMPLRAKEIVPRITLPESCWIGGLAFSPDSKQLATASSDGKARVWDVASGKLLSTLEGHAAEVVSVAYSKDGEWLATGSYDRSVKIWEVRTSSIKHTFKGHRGAALCVAFHPREPILATSSIDQTVNLWEINANKYISYLHRHKSWVNALAFSPDGRHLVSVSSDGTVMVWSMPKGELLRTIDATKAEVRSVAFSRDGKQLAAGIRYGIVRTWDTETWQERLNFTAHEGDVWAVAFSADGKRLLTGNGDWKGPGQIKTWDAASGKLISERKHPGEVLSLVVSPDGKTAAAAGRDRTVSVWEMDSEPRP